MREENIYSLQVVKRAQVCLSVLKEVKGNIAQTLLRQIPILELLNCTFCELSSVRSELLKPWTHPHFELHLRRNH